MNRVWDIRFALPSLFASLVLGKRMQRHVSTALIAAWLLVAVLHLPLLANGNSMDTRLHNAAAADDVAAIHRLLASGANIDARDESGATALLVAAHGNKVNAAHALIEAGADVNAKDDIQDSPYLYSGARGHLEILKLTLAHGADLASVNRYGGTALIPASERGHGLWHPGGHRPDPR